ncbi:MAG: glycosyltransferase family 4 protein [Prochlorotrichaceae cyanobacterium]|jgi:glycosyltransferase involved in cell wall biosynthesis
MRILMISTTFPYPPTLGGTEVRTYNLLCYLKQHGHEIDLVTQLEGLSTILTASPEQPLTSPSDIPDQVMADIVALRQVADTVAVFPLPPSPPDRPGLRGKIDKGLRFLQSIFSNIPPYIVQRRSLEMQTWISDRVRAGHYDVLTCEHSLNTMYIQADFFDYARIVINVHSSMYGAMRDALESGASSNPKRDQFYLSIVYRYEKKYCNQPYQLVVTTPEDQDLLKAFNAQAPITIVTNGVDLELFPYRSQDPGGYKLIFVGAMDVTHNIDAATFFAQSVFPSILERYPQAEFYIVGGKPTPAVQALGEHPRVIVTGRVPSMVDYLHQATVCVVPLRTGYGIKNKTLEAMAAGVPVVGSDRGLEGLNIEGSRALRANTVAEYVAALEQLFEHSDLRSTLSRSARAYVETTFTWERAGLRYEAVLSGKPSQP